MAFEDVSLEDIQQQLQLLGHSVPDDLVNAYLMEVNATNYAPESYENQLDDNASLAARQIGPDLKSASSSRAPSCNPNAIGSMNSDRLQGGGDSFDQSRSPAADTICKDRSNGQFAAYSGRCEGTRAVESSGMPRLGVTRVPEMLSQVVAPAAAGNSADEPNPPSFQSQQATDSFGTVPLQESHESDHLLPEDVLNRARSIINEHMAEHQMPLVKSLSNFTLKDLPPGRISSDPDARTGGSVPSRTATHYRGTECAVEEPFIHDAHKIPHTATIPTSTRPGPPPQAARRPGTAPSRQPRAPLYASAHDDHENTVGENGHVDAHIARLQRGASSRRNALESLEGSMFNSDLSHDDLMMHSGSKSHYAGRPATAGGRPHVAQSGAEGVRASAASSRRHFSSHGMGGDGCELEEFRYRPERHRPRASSPERTRLRPQVNLNSSFLTGRSCLSGQARKVDRVARYQQLSKQWSKDQFLSTTSRRRKQGFQEAYAAAHELSQAELAATKATNSSDRPHTASRRPYVPPGEKRRDRLRWDVRTRMQMQDNM